MGKSVLGDDPFGTPSPDAPAAERAASASADDPVEQVPATAAVAGGGKRRGKKRRGGAAEATPSGEGAIARPDDVRGSSSADAPVAPEAAAEVAAADEMTGAEPTAAGEAEAEGVDPSEEGDFGVEAAAPERDYGPPIDDADRRLPHQAISSEIKEIERRFRERFLPGHAESDRRKIPLEFLWRWWRDFAMQDRSDVVDEFGRDPLYAAKIDPFLELLYSKYFRVEATGLENIPDGGRALIVANHSGTLPYDGAMIMYATRRDHPAHRDVRPLVEDFVFHFPYLGTFINRIGGVRACQENAERLLEKDQLVAVFPEGIKGIGKLWRDRYRLQRFGRGGFIKLALRTDAPIIPAAVIGAEEIHPMLTKVTWLARSVGIPYLPITPTFPWLGPLGLVPLPTKWYLRFGAPLYFNAEYGAEAASDRILVNRLAENVRSHIQEMIDVKLAERKSVLLG